MSDPAKPAEIEDVLSSIRRLVTEDNRTKPSVVRPARLGLTDRLVLTPADRVEAKPELAPPVQDTPSEPESRTDDATADAPAFDKEVAAFFQPDPESEPAQSESDPVDHAAAQPDDEVIEIASDERKSGFDLAGPPAPGTADEPTKTILMETDADIELADAPVWSDGSAFLLETAQRTEALEKALQPAEPKETDAALTQADDDHAEMANAPETTLTNAEHRGAAPADESAEMSGPTLDENESPEDASDMEMASDADDGVAETTGAGAGESPPDPDRGPVVDNQIAATADQDTGETAETEDPLDDAVSEPAETTRAASLSAKIEALETAIAETQDDWEPDGVGTDDNAGTAGEALQWQDHDPETGVDTPDVAALESLMQFRARPRPEPEEVKLPDRTTSEISLPGEPILDEEALRDMVADIVRQELQGVLGERITRNVRKLVRREIQRALSVQELE